MNELPIKRVDIIFSKEFDTKNIIEKSLKLEPDEIIARIVNSGLKGRGGAGFPTGLKWKLAAEQQETPKYVICNADEGEPGTFKDRELLTEVPFKLYAGLTIAAHAIGAKKAFIYLRGEYKYLIPDLKKELDQLNQLLKACNKELSIEFRYGSGAYICGEESALFESMEGKRGEPQNKPPYPTSNGFLNKPTVINNVETLIYTAIIMQIGIDQFKKLGTTDSRGSKVFSVSGDTPIPGIYELELGMTVKQFVDEFGDGDSKAVQVGGASGFCVPRKRFDKTIIGFEGVPTGGSMKLFNSSRSMYNILHNYLVFFSEESCGQCTPCRIGCQQLLKGIEAVKKGEKKSIYLNDLLKLAGTMKLAAKCGLGQSVGNAFKSIVENFREEIIY